jgi:hypothetical protein
VNIPVLFLAIGSNVLNAAGGAAEHVARSGPLSRGINLPDAITYALFGCGLIAIAVVRRRRT